MITRISGTDTQTDRRALPSALYPCFAVEGSKYLVEQLQKASIDA